MRRAPKPDNLNKQLLDKLPKQDQIEEMIVGQENFNSHNALPPRTPNYGKTPKYIEKYKEEAKVIKEIKLEEKAAKNRPVGTKVLPESERIATLETLLRNKKDVTTILNQLPISMRTENLKK